MATIAKLVTQDGPVAVGPAPEGAGGESGAEFLTLLSVAAGAAPAPAFIEVPDDAAPARDEPVADDLVAMVPDGVAALMAAGDIRRAHASSAEPLRRAAGEPAPGVRLQRELPPSLPASIVTSGAKIAVAAGEAPGGPVVTLLPDTAPVAAAVLHALQVATPPDPPVTVPSPGRASGAASAPVADVIAQLSDAIEYIAAADDGARTTHDGENTATGTAGPPAAGGPVVRDAAAGTPYHHTVPGTVGTPAWRHALGTEVRMMIERGVGAATLRLSPEHLGPVEVRIDFTDDGANVWFSASHADTRTALAEAVPRLRDMLASVGVNLGEAGVRRDLPGEPERRDGAWHGSEPAPTEAGGDSRVVVTLLDAGRGMLDEYA